MALDGASVTQILLTERIRITASIWAVVRDSHLAEDLFQETVMRAIREPSQFREEDHVLPWALTTARNLAIDTLRRRDRTASILSELALQRVDDFWQARSSQEVAARIDSLYECLDRLPAQSREMIRLRYEQEHSCSEVSSQLERSLTATYKSLSRIHLQLKECVERAIRSTKDDTTSSPIHDS